MLRYLKYCCPVNVTLGQLHAFNPTIFEAPVLTSRKYKLIALANKIIGPPR